MKKPLFVFETIGSDPEFFIVDKNENPVPSTNIFDGTKENPEDKGDGYAVLKDNVLVEGNIPPASTRDEFVNNMRALKYLINRILEMSDLELHCDDSMLFTEEDLVGREANRFGCAAYNNAWKGLEGVAVANMSKLKHRVAGTHIHIGYGIKNFNYDNRQINRVIAKAFDLMVTIPARRIHNDNIRNTYYGELGSFRDTPYGLECRTLGGYFSKDKYLGWIYDNTVKAVEFASDEDNFKKLEALGKEDLKDIDKVYSDLKIDINELIKID